ncbi:hypothetical protein [Thauera butanivorans]|uniref:hypothetical protein n=1 Tax=Thauera butanivorans TaxID=86174 RepID=UPI000837C286|nr:hypothetical protein [Thauera butanivorans]
MKHNATLRQQVLTHLYADREAAPRGGWVSLFDLRQALGEVEFALSVLEELGHVRRDGNRYRITGHGVAACEAGHGV